MQTQLMLPPKKKHHFTTPARNAGLPVKRPASGNTAEVSTPKKTKWTRGPDWMLDEEIRLSQLCKENREILDGDFRGLSNGKSGELTNAKKNELWQRITTSVNSVAACKRNVKQMKRKWRQLRSNGTFIGCCAVNVVLCEIPFVLPFAAHKQKCHVSALAKNSSNMRGTGGGEGTELTEAETNALDSYSERDSEVAAGVDGGYKTQIIVVWPCSYLGCHDIIFAGSNKMISLPTGAFKIFAF